MKRYLFLESDAAAHLASTIERMAAGKLMVGDIHARQARTLLEQLPHCDQPIAAWLVTVNRGRVHAVAGRRAACELVTLLGPIQGWRVWHLARLSGTRPLAAPPRHSDMGAVAKVAGRWGHS